MPVLCQTLSAQLAPRRNQERTGNEQVAGSGAGSSKASANPATGQGVGPRAEGLLCISLVRAAWNRAGDTREVSELLGRP